MQRIAAYLNLGESLSQAQQPLECMINAVPWRGDGDVATWYGDFASMATYSASRDTKATVARGGHQDASIVLAFDGELYNRREIITALGAGADSADLADGELLLHCYLQWSDDFLHRVDGIFAFVLWDGNSQSAILGRDRLGIKPLYYCHQDRQFLVASEPKSIFVHPSFKASLDYHALPMLLQPRLMRAGETGVKGLSSLPPGHCLYFSATGKTLRPYWKLEGQHHGDNAERTAETVAQLLQESVRRRVNYDDAILGTMLSGGLDSTSVLSLSSRLKNSSSDIHSFCLEYEDQKAHFVASELRPDIDAPYAERAAREIGCRHHPIKARLADLVEAEPISRLARDFPAWGQFDTSMYMLFKTMSSHCGAVMTGEIADEIFGGYPYCFEDRLQQIEGFPWMGDGPKLVDYLSESIRRDVNPAEDEAMRFQALLADMPRNEEDSPEEERMREILYLGMAGPTTVLIDRMERMSAAANIQIRFPFCDHRLIEYVWNVPWHLKSQGGVKGLLKKAVANEVPKFILKRKKSAYPHIQNPAYDQRIIAESRALLTDPRSIVSVLFDQKKLISLIDDVEAGRVRGALPGSSGAAKLLIHLVELEYWITQNKISV